MAVAGYVIGKKIDTSGSSISDNSLDEQVYREALSSFNLQLQKRTQLS